MLSFPKETVPKLGSEVSEHGPVLVTQYSGASVIHSAELRAAPETAAVSLADLPVVTSFRVTVNLPVLVEYFTVADIVLPGETLTVVKLYIWAG